MHLVQCRICKEKFDTEKLIPEQEWIMPSRNFYYHRNCYDDWAKKRNDVHSTGNEELWFDAVWQYLRREKRMSLDFNKLKSQWDNFIKKNYTPKGIYFCLRYFYDVKKGDVAKGEGGIGIIPYIYKEGTEYWANRELREKGICAKIEEQIRQAQNREKITIKYTDKKNRFKKYDLDEIGED